MKRTCIFSILWTFVILVSASHHVHAEKPKPLVKFQGCTLIPTDWADGDSFLVKTPRRRTFTLRLYGADCMEWHVHDDSDARRLRAQRRYFGISKVSKNHQSAIQLAKDFGQTATTRVTELLKKPFTVYTAFADGRGDGKHKRYYGFISTSDNRDLASVLVTEGLARAFGVYRETPTGISSKEYRAHLKDMELQAVMRRVGIWAKTDWNSLPAERRLQREEDAELQLAKTTPPAPLDPNNAARDKLMLLPGIGETMANRIIEGREQGPYKKKKDLIRIPGIGPKTLEKIQEYLIFQAPYRVDTPETTCFNR